MLSAWVGELGGAEDDEVVQIGVLHHLFGIGTLERVLDLPGRELGGLVLDAELVEPLGQREVVAGPEVGDVRRGVDQCDLDGLVLRPGIGNGLPADDRLERLEFAFGVHLLRYPVVAVGVVGERLERQVGGQRGAARESRRGDQRQ